MKFKTFLQLLIICLIFGSFYFIYSAFFSKKNYVEEISDETNISNKQTIDIAKDQEDNIILNLEYKSLDSLGNEYFIKSETAESTNENLNLLNLKKVTAIVKLVNKPDIFITSDFAKHDKETFDTEFYGNVKIKHDDIRVFSENLDLLYNKNLVSLYNISEAYNKKTKMTADKINYDILTRDLEIIMYNKNDKIEIIIN